MTLHRGLIARFIAGNFGIMAFGDIYFLMALYLQDVGVTDPRTLGWILGIYFAASTITRPVTSILIERFAFRPIMMTASVLCLASGAGVALAGTSVPLILIFRALTGFSSSLFVVGLTTYQTLTIPEEIRGSSFTLSSAGTIAPLFAILPIAEWLLRNGHSFLYIWSPLLPAILCLVVANSLPPAEDFELMKGNWGTYSDIFRIPASRTLLTSIVLFAMTDAIILSMGGLALEKGVLASSFISSQALTGLLIRVFGFRVMDRIPRSRIAALTFAVTATSAIAITFVNSNTGMVLWGVVYGIAMGYGFPMHLSLIGDAVPERLRPKATSLLWFFMAGCYFASPVITGFLASWLNFAWAFRIICGVILLSSPLMYRQFLKTFEKNSSFRKIDNQGDRS
ncbi:MAG: MFS transporter [Thermovirgaceae bacterium]|nr:MFS transporter [Thermovirgaceae bacterium]